MEEKLEEANSLTIPLIIPMDNHCRMTGFDFQQTSLIKDQDSLDKMKMIKKNTDKNNGKLSYYMMREQFFMHRDSIKQMRTSIYEFKNKSSFSGKKIKS
jgi:hypothetical protein